MSVGIRMVMTKDIPRDSLRAFSIIVAATPAGGIGKAGTVPWRLPTDLKFFKGKTCAVIGFGSPILIYLVIGLVADSQTA